MANDQDSRAGVTPAVDLSPKIDVSAVIKALIGLVEQQQLGPTQLSEHDVQLLAGSAAELAHRLFVPRAPAQRCRELKPDLGFHYLAVDGPIGVGKTTLVEMLTRRFEGVKILEDVDNPFLGDFYQDRPGAAFQTELYFLLSRYKQQQEVYQRGLFDRLVLADYTFEKDRIFAYLNLTDEELSLYDKLYKLLEPQVRTPDLVLYLVNLGHSTTTAASLAGILAHPIGVGQVRVVVELRQDAREVIRAILFEFVDGFEVFLERGVEVAQIRRGSHAAIV